MKVVKLFLGVLLAGYVAVSSTSCCLGVGSGGRPAPKLVALSISPVNPSLPAGVPIQFAASGKYSDGKNRNMTEQVHWKSSHAKIATVDFRGWVVFNTRGSATITATSGKISASTTVTVNSAALTAITVTPPHLTLPMESYRQFTANGRYSDDKTYDITAQVTWFSSNPLIAAVDPAGLVKGVGPGTAVITAMFGRVSGSRSLAVTSFLSSLSLAPVNPILPVGSYKVFTAAGIYSDGSNKEIRTEVTWSSSDPKVAAISPSGMVTTLAPGQATITAVHGAVSGQTTLTVTALTLSSIALSHASPNMTVGGTQQFKATGVYSEGTINDITAQVTWSSSNPSVASVNDAGLVTGVGEGLATITASSAGASGSTALTVRSK